MDVDIDSDPRLAACDPEHQIGTLGADSAKRQQHLFVAWEVATKFADNKLGNCMNLSGFRPMKSARSDQSVNRVGTKFCQFCCRAGRGE